MAVVKIVDTVEEDELKILDLSFYSPSVVQVQIEQDGNDAYINLDKEEARKLVSELNKWIDSK